MRLIDAEPLVAISWKAHKDETYERGFEDGVCHALDRIEQAPTIDAVEVVRCRDCKHYEVKDHWVNFGGVPILAASDVPTCHKWSDGCMTKPDGYCFMGERRDDDATD